MRQQDFESGRPFHGSRLRLARNFQGMTLANVAEAVATSAPYIHQIESGDRTPTESMVAALASAVGFHPSFFEAPVDDAFSEEDCQFRAPKRMSAGLRTRVLSHGTLFQQFVRLLERYVKLPTPQVRTFETTGRDAVERAAETVRRENGLGLDRPITHLPRLLERMGVVVTSFEASGKLDAFSRPVPGARPVIVLNSDKGSTSRTRFDLAHEFGHIVLHQGRPGYDEGKEQDADAFASAFLLPRVGFLREFPVQARLSWDVVWSMKKRWKVSGAAIVRRAHDLGRITPDEYRRAWKHYMYKGYHRGELFEPEEDPPEMIANALRVLARRKRVPELAAELGWSARTFEQVVGVPADEGGEEADPPKNVLAFRRK